MPSNNSANNILKIYQQNQFPVFQNKVYFSEIEATNCILGDIDIVQDLTTGLIHNAAFKPELMVYDESYNNEQGVSDLFNSHLNWVARTIETHLGKQNLVEVGCGKGYFLELLLRSGFDITGFDSTYAGDNPRIIKQYFEPGIIKTPAHGLILRHVLEHIPNPVDFLYALRDSNNGQGMIYIEVPCFDWIMENRTWFDIFYEHVNYFRIDDFNRMFGRVIECGHCFGGQYLYVIADLSTLRQPKYTEKNKVNFPENFLDSLKSIPEQPQKFINQKHRVAVWGGSSKGVIYSLLRERIGYPVDFVIDINPAKQGRYLPITGLKIYSPSDALMRLIPGSSVYIMNSNYLSEIKEISNHIFNYIGVDQ